MIRINEKVIGEFRPCKDRFENFKEAYPGADFSLVEFLKLDKISHRDKVWVSVRLMTRTQKVKYAILNAESVLHIFEKKYPDNKAPRELLDYLKTFDSFEEVTPEQRGAILELRRKAAADADAAYADAAAAAAAAADAAADAADAAADAADAAAADAAAADADADADAAAAYAARKVQEEKLLQFILVIFKDEV